MITSKNDLKQYLNLDKKALKIPENRYFPRPIVDDIWKYQILLRKAEYYHNVSNSLISRVFFNFYRFRLISLGEKLGFSIGLNVFGPGLSIAHFGCIVVNSGAKIGSNCRIHEGVTIGATNGSNEAAVIGDNCFIGSGAKIIGNIKIGNNVAIGAGSVVVRDIELDSVTVAGVPAKIVSNNDSSSNIVKLDL